MTYTDWWLVGCALVLLGVGIARIVQGVQRTRRLVRREKILMQRMIGGPRS